MNIKLLILFESKINDGVDCNGWSIQTSLLSINHIVRRYQNLLQDRRFNLLDVVFPRV